MLFRTHLRNEEDDNRGAICAETCWLLRFLCFYYIFLPAVSREFLWLFLVVLAILAQVLRNGCLRSTVRWTFLELFLHKRLKSSRKRCPPQSPLATSMRFQIPAPGWGCRRAGWLGKGNGEEIFSWYDWNASIIDWKKLSFMKLIGIIY